MNIAYKKVAVGAFLLMFGSAFVTSCLSYFVVPITTDPALLFDRAPFLVYYTLFFVVTMVMMPIGGKLAGKIGVRKIVLIGGIWTALVFALLSQSNSLPMFYIAGVLLGLTGQICTNLMATILVNTWFIKGRGSLMGTVGAASSVCGVIAGFVMPWLLESAGWHSSYIALGISVLIVTLVPALFLIKDSPNSIGLLPYGAEEEKEGAAPSEALTGVSYKKAITSAPFFILFFCFLVIAIVAGVLQNLPAFFVSKGLTDVEAGTIMSIFMAAMIVAKILMGVLNDKLGVKATVAIVVGLFAASCAIMPFASGYVALAAIMIVMSMGFGSVAVLGPLIAAKVFGQREFGGIWGILGMSAALGTALGAPIWGAVFDATQSYSVGFFISAVLLALSIILIFFSVNAAKKLPRS
jgi:MFS family permease